MIFCTLFLGFHTKPISRTEDFFKFEVTVSLLHSNVAESIFNVEISGMKVFVILEIWKRTYKKAECQMTDIGQQQEKYKEPILDFS